MNQLSSRERILRTIQGQEIDKIPCYFRAEDTLCVELQKRFGLSNKIELAKHLASDAFQVLPSYRPVNQPPDVEKDHFYDMYGNYYRVTHYNHMVSTCVERPALAPEGELKPIDSIPWPSTDVLDMERSLQNIKNASESGMAIYGGIWATLFTAARELLGQELFLITMFENPEYIHQLLDKVTETFLSLNQVYLDACAKYVDVYYFGTDFGTQRSLFFSPAHFDEFFKPCMARIVAQAKQYDLPVMFHTCGSVVPIIPSLIDIGIDVLDPVQVSAEGMDPHSLSQFRGKIAFNGGVSTQTTLPFGTPQEVRSAVDNLIQELGPRRLIVAPDQDMIGNIPFENIWELFSYMKQYIL